MEVAKLLNIAPAQVVLSWLRQRGVVVLPKSIQPNRIEENIRGKPHYERWYLPPRLTCLEPRCNPSSGAVRENRTCGSVTPSEEDDKSEVCVPSLKSRFLVR